MTTIYNGKSYRLEAQQFNGADWRVVIATGNRNRGTRKEWPVSEACYTMHQAQAFVRNNRAIDFLCVLGG